MNNNKYTQLHMKKINNFESKRINEDKIKKKHKEKPNNNNKENKEKIIDRERRTLYQFNDKYKLDKFKSESNNDKENKNKVKDKKLLNKNIIKINKSNTMTNNFNEKYYKIKFVGKTLNQNIKKNIANTSNYNLFAQTNQNNSNNQLNTELNNISNNHHNNYGYNEKFLTVNKSIQNNMQNKICGFKKMKNYKYKPINNNIQNYHNMKNRHIIHNNNNIIFKTIEPHLNDDIYDYSNVKKTIYKEINSKKDNIQLISNDQCKNNVLSIEMNNFTKNNFHKNNSSSSIYCSPNKINLLDNKRTIDDKNFNIYNNFEKIKNKNNYIYKKNYRNISCIKSRGSQNKIENESETDKNEFKNTNKSIVKNKYLQISFNSPVSSNNKKNERNSVSYLNSNKRIMIQNNKTNNQNNKCFEVNEFFNPNDREKSKYTTIQNSEDELKSNTNTIKTSDKKYYYQTIQDNNYNYDNVNSFKIDTNKNKTFKRKNNNFKNKIIYENNVNSFDKNYDNEYYENEDDYKLGLNNYQNNYNVKTPSINNDLYKNDSDFINIGRQRNNFNNKISDYKNNSKIIKTNLPKRTIINDPINSIIKKKYANSYNNEFSDTENYNFNNRTKLKNNKEKKCQKLILNRKLNPNINLYSSDNNELNENITNFNDKDNYKTLNNSILFKSKKNSTGKSSPKYILNDDAPSPTLLENEGIYNNYLYGNSKTKEDFYKDNRKTDSKVISLKNVSIESSPKCIKKSIYHKKNSQNHFSINNPGILNEINNITDFNKTCYIKKQINKKNIYHKQNIKNKISDFSTTTENKTLKKEQTDNYSINSSHNSNNNKNINTISNNTNTNNNTFSNKKNNNISISVESINLKNEFFYSLIDLKDKVIINNHFMNHKLYNYGMKKPLPKLYYMDKNKKYRKKSKKRNNMNINVSNISENKYNDNNSFSISFNNNQKNIKKNNNKDKDKNKDFINEDILYNAKSSDYDSKDSEENIKKFSGIKKNENEFIYNDFINFDLSGEKDEKNLTCVPKKDNYLIKRNVNDFNYNFVQSEEEEENDRNKKIISLKKNFEKINNKIKINELYNNYLSNSTSKKENKHPLKNEKFNQINIEKMSLFTKKLSDVLFKKQNVEEEKIDKENNNKKNCNKKNNNNNNHIINKNSNKNNNNNNADVTEGKNKEDNAEKNKRIRKSLTEKEFVLGYFKLNDIFTKKYNDTKDRNTMTLNNNMTQFIENRIEEEMNDYDLNDEIKMKQKLYTYKIKPKNILLEDQEIFNEFNDDKKEIKVYNIKKILLLKNNKFSLKDDLLNNRTKIHMNDLLHPEVEAYKIKENNEYNINNQLELINTLNENNIKETSVQIINEFNDNIYNIIRTIFNKIIIDKSNINLYAKLCRDINISSVKNDKEIINLGKIIINEFTNRINNSIDNNDNIENFLMETISFDVISIEEGFNLCLNLYDNFEKTHKYIILEKCIYLYEFLITKFFKNHNIEGNNTIIPNLIVNIEYKLNNCISKDKNLDKKLKEIIINIINKRKHSLGEKENNNKNKIRVLNDANVIKIKNNYNENSKNNNLNESDKKEEGNDIKKINAEVKNDENNTIKIKKNNNINENISKEDNQMESKLISIENKEEIQIKNKYSKTNSNFYSAYPKLISNKQINIKDNNDNNVEQKNINKNNINEILNNDIISSDINNDNNTTKNSHTITHKKKSKKKSKSSEKRIIPKSNGEINNNTNEKNKEVIRKDYQKYMEFLKNQGIEKKEDLYDELNDLYNWKTIDNLIQDKKVKLEEIIKIYIYDICKNDNGDKKQMTNIEIFLSNEYIKTIIEYYTSTLSKNQIEILHLNMIEIYMDIDVLISNENNEAEDDSFMHQIMGNLLFVLLKNKLLYMKDLNNFMDKSRETQINIAKVVKYCIIASGNNTKQYHNDFKFTKLFNNNDIFNLYVTKEIFDSKNK